MRLLFLSLLTLMSVNSFCQADQAFSFLIVTTGRDYDQHNERFYQTIRANNNSKSLSELLQLVPYESRRIKKNASTAFYKEQSDTAATFYNYFSDESEVLQFISSKGWELFSVIAQVTSDAGEHMVNGQYQTFTRIATTPVYYFRKRLK